MTKSQNKRLRNRHLLSWNSTQASQIGLTGTRSGNLRAFNSQDLSQDAAGSPIRVMMRRLHLVSMIALFVVAAAPLLAATGGSVSGVVRDSSGVLQMGAVVQLLRSDMSVVAASYTNDKGTYSFADILPGKYAVKAMGALFLPSLRENVRVRANTVVNLTLNTLYEVMEWLPAEARAPNAPKDDWERTLRSAANRPLLRWLQGGPLVGGSGPPGRSAKAEGAVDGDRAGRNFRRERRAIYSKRGRYSFRKQGTAGAGGLCAEYRCGHGVDAWFPPGPGLCRSG